MKSLLSAAGPAGVEAAWQAADSGALVRLLGGIIRCVKMKDKREQKIC